MTERQGVFPPEGAKDGTFHQLRSVDGHILFAQWVNDAWLLPGQHGDWSGRYMLSLGWTYLGPAPTYEQSQADAADARRFRFLLGMWWWKDDALRDLFHTNVEDDRIRAAIDAAMKGDSDA